MANIQTLPAGEKDITKIVAKIRELVAADTIGQTALQATTSLTAGGSTTMNLLISSASIGVYVGSGVPTVVAAQGSLYLRNNGTGTTSRAYINTDSGSTWTAMITAA